MNNLAQLKKLKKAGKKSVCVTAYDAIFARKADLAEIEMILVGDSLGMVVQGHSTTLPVKLADMIYHTEMVQRGNQNAWCIADLPFMADASLEKGLDSAQQLMQAGANMVKMEGGQRVLPLVSALSELGVPVCGHLGLLPQSVQKTGYRVQGKQPELAEKIYADALALQEAGADMLVLECVPASLAKRISAVVDMIVIGIGSGRDTDAQVLVLQDLLGLTETPPSFAQNFLEGEVSILGALQSYSKAVKTLQFPKDEHILAH